MKSIILSLMLALTGCTIVKEEVFGIEEPCKDKLDKCVLVQHEWAIRAFDEDCSKLAKCMKMNYEILNLADQPHNPYACSVTDPKRKWVSHYYYPKGRISFGEVEYDRLSEAIATCEMMTGTGEKSKARYDSLMAAFDRMDRERKERERQMDEAKKVKPAVKVRVVK